MLLSALALTAGLSAHRDNICTPADKTCLAIEMYIARACSKKQDISHNKGVQTQRSAWENLDTSDDCQSAFKLFRGCSAAYAPAQKTVVEKTEESAEGCYYNFMYSVLIAAAQLSTPNKTEAPTDSQPVTKNADQTGDGFVGHLCQLF
jgi:hypothetical protein